MGYRHSDPRVDALLDEIIRLQHIIEELGAFTDETSSPVDTPGSPPSQESLRRSDGPTPSRSA